MTYEEFLSIVRHDGNAGAGMARRGWSLRGNEASGWKLQWVKTGAGGRIAAHGGDETWQADTLAEWKAQHG